MKSLFLFPFLFCLMACQTQAVAQEAVPAEIALVGEWQLDMTPENPDDEAFAKMIIREVSDGSFTGIFYRDGVRIREGRINQQTGRLYGALVSGDNSGRYATSFYFEDGKLYGTTHAIERQFLSVWVGVRVER
ncbi:MAG: hypothetical protein AAFY36_16205 [Bacteroidota bacterium]